MANLKKMAAFVAAFVCVMVMNVLSSCSGSEDIKMTQAAPKTITVKEEVPVLVLQDKLYPVLSNVMISDHNIFINGKSVATYEVEHKYPTIEMPAADHKAASVESFDGETLRDTNGQMTNISVNIVPGSDYSLTATITPNEEYSKIQRLHAKVSMVTTYYTLSGYVTVTVDGETKSNDFALTIARHYLLVDETIDIETVVRTDTIEKLVVHTDTTIVEVEKIVEKIVNTTDTVYIDKPVEVIVNHTDTITVEVERFVRGADINKSVINDLGYSVGTLMLGNKQLLKVEIRHQSPVLDVEKDKLGNVSFTGVGSLVWNGDDSQISTASEEKNNVTVKSFDYVRNEYTKVSETMYIVRTVYSVTGSFYNENSDLIEFSMELSPSYMQKYEEAVITPQVDQFVWTFEDKLTYETANGVCKGMLKVTGKKTNTRTGEVVAEANLGRTNVIKIGHPTGLELFVTGSDIIDYSKDIRPFTGDDSNWTGTTEKSGFEITKQTMIYEFSTWFAADAVAGGKVGPQTQLYFLSCEVSFKDPETGEVVYHKVFEKNATSNSEEFLTEDALVGQTRVESDKTYKYEKSYKRTFKAYIDGQEIFSPEAVSSLWVPVQ